MIKITLFLAALFISLQSFAQAPPSNWDAQATYAFQTYPLGTLASATAGYGLNLWSAPSDGSPDFFKYGYLRPFINYQTAIVTNRITGALEFYPISILGLSGGGGWDHRNYSEFIGVDCSRYTCNGDLSFQYLQAQLIVGVDKFLLVVNGRYDWYHTKEHQSAFYDYMSYLVGRAGGDDLRALTLLGLYRPNETWNYGILATYQNMLATRSNNSAVYAIGHYTQGMWQYTLGLGDYKSDFMPINPSMIFSVQYTLKKTIGLLN